MSHSETFADGIHTVWIAVRTYFSQEFKVSRYLEQRHVQHFIPMVVRHVWSGTYQPQLRRCPVVHNLIFIALEQQRIDEMRHILQECPYAIYVYRSFEQRGSWFLIPDHELADLRLICDNNFGEPIFTSTEQCDLKVGCMVSITHGPLKNTTGKLIRKDKKFYLVRTFGELAVLLRVSRWCCKKIETDASDK